MTISFIIDWFIFSFTESYSKASLVAMAVPGLWVTVNIKGRVSWKSDVPLSLRPNKQKNILIYVKNSLRKSTKIWFDGLYRFVPKTFQQNATGVGEFYAVQNERWRDSTFEKFKMVVMQKVGNTIQASVDSLLSQ